MITRRRVPYIPQRVRVLFSCEGQSERAYGIWLNRLALQAGLHINIESKICRPPGGGDLLSLVNDTEKVIKHAHQMRVPYSIKALILDDDMRNRSAARDVEALQIAARHGIHIIWQVCDHEAFLLRHFPGCHTKAPPRGQSMAAIRRVIPGYNKPLSADDLGKLIDIAALRRVIAVEAELRILLNMISWTL